MASQGNDMSVSMLFASNCGAASSRAQQGVYLGRQMPIIVDYGLGWVMLVCYSTPLGFSRQGFQLSKCIP